ncbi:hypothetical protein [Azospirillum agricola]|uniref:hypothetical protein n=1 Tax=Azospirillum agricola TaxID=1720247 RepID=UPI000A0F21F4|nr:hypothetical protein [Azospirillum agricola]MBP2229179.1 putative membrane protein YvbJ [Azospirillum agricola]SMH60580.1 hypothetical protein SAMN02982994_5606 [Azospirillum lipoferum]
MALIPCAACGHMISAQAPSCPSCGHPGANAPNSGREGVARIAGTVAGSYISAQMLASVIVGSVAIISFAAIMIAVILKG